MTHDSREALEQQLKNANDVIEDLVRQFGCYGRYNGRLCLNTCGLSALEQAFAFLGWNEPRPVPESECQIADCYENATTGAPTEDGYKRMCGDHYRALAIQRR